ncbi:MAG: Rid family hydrolase [bacterium]|nr:Rid family hydrolase [bacterium]
MKHIYTAEAPTPGAYSQGVLVNGILYLSGQTGNDVNLKDEAVVDGGVGSQTTQALKNLLAVVRAAGGDVSCFIRLKVFLKDSGSAEARQNDWRSYNEAYKSFLPSVVLRIFLLGLRFGQ